MARNLIILFSLVYLLSNPWPAICADAPGGWNEVGLRMGLQAGYEHGYFRQYEMFAVYGLPWDWRSSSGWGLAPQLSVSAGALLDDPDVSGFIGTVGAGLVLDKPHFGLAPEIGINANFLDKRHFGDQDFGSMLLFGAYIGLFYRFDDGLKIGYRLQHISNGHIFYEEGTPNPGLDMHLIAVSWTF
ncbi:MAG: acyloxyacyl hydrolase [Oryzomonas sp.]|uniref:acyloxyacyl hydrolase n=1 Tax=Oryzomonas sp. TaxID=2855186 RepID=UPI002844D1CF|nr:acyloxyacyl hydrolase [Oryzomonas sp.]MDR3579104.1 acyloxyacyl hydrolase [Oryzomonas sp.]